MKTAPSVHKGPGSTRIWFVAVVIAACASCNDLASTPEPLDDADLTEIAFEETPIPTPEADRLPYSFERNGFTLAITPPEVATEVFASVRAGRECFIRSTPDHPAQVGPTCIRRYPTEGRQFIAVLAGLRNDTNEEKRTSGFDRTFPRPPSFPDLVLETRTGARYRPDFGRPYSWPGSLEPFESALTKIVFDVPSGETPSRLIGSVTDGDGTRIVLDASSNNWYWKDESGNVRSGLRQT